MKKPKIKKVCRWITGGVLILLLGFVMSVAVYFFYPNVSALKKQNPQKTSFMAYRMAEWKAQGKKVTLYQTWTPLNRVSPYVIKAVIIAEDDKFWDHEGFDFQAIQQALEKGWEKKKFKAGGSTITQQLAKNLYLTPARNPVRKMKEAILTWRLERTLSKRRIIELYLNVAEWGEGIFGIEAAARKHFGKRASALSAREAAQLAAVLPNPRRYNPTSGSRYVERRAGIIYRIMVQRKIVIPAYEEVMSQPHESSGEGESAEAAEAELAAEGDIRGNSHDDDESSGDDGEQRDNVMDEYQEPD
ncbi:MAG: monofunctional biosynthetic peptidoglycan transglycosylase [Syntrophobacterales bacterium]|nr:monofunctional biosynthetic peptidoglycan transglycosylase [Syntrophobacterales bacterium]